MATPVVKNDYTFTLERGTTWGSAIQDTPLGIPTEEMKVGQEATAHYIPIAKGVRGQQEATTWQNTSSTFPTATFDCPASPAVLKNVLPALFQSDPDWTPATNVYTLFTYNCSGLPNVTGSNEGYFYTLNRRNDCDSTNSDQLASALMKSLKLSLARDANEGVLWMSTEWIGKGFNRGVTLSSGVTHMSVSGMYEFDNRTAVTYGSYDLTSAFISMEMNITDGAKFIRDIPTANVVFPMWEVEGTLVVAQTSDTNTMKSEVLSRDVDSARTLTFGWTTGAVSADGEMQIDCNAYLTSFESDYEEGEVITFGFKGVMGTNGGVSAAGEHAAKITFYAA